jgi:SAM-dependent methyltransferase
LTSRERALQVARRLVAPVRPVLYRDRPFTRWGFGRGTPIDRRYIEQFLAAHRADISGHVLEVKDSTYTDRFGTGVTSNDVLDIDPANPRATIVADLSAADEIPADTFDCFIFTQTLQLISDLPSAIGHIHRIIRPGGVLLATVPSIIRVDTLDRDQDRWRFTEASSRELFGAAFGPDRVDVSTVGNVAAAVAFLLGMAAEELSARKLARVDPDFPVVVTARAVKAGS